MIKLLYVVASLDYSGAAQKVTALATGLPRDRFAVRVAVLGSGGPLVERFRAAGIAVDLLAWKRAIDLRPLMAVRDLCRSFQPQVVHVWSRKALRTIAAAGTAKETRLLASNLLKPGHPLAVWDRLLVRRADTVVAFSAAEAERYRHNGVAAERIARVTPGIETGTDDPAPTGAAPVALPNGRYVLGIGPLEVYKGFRDAVWALDILHYLYRDLHLLLAGVGSDRLRIAQFAQAVGATRRVHFLGRVADLGPVLRGATAVWVPSRIQGGVGAALQAMAAARPVVASRAAGLDEIVVDGITGFLVKPGDKAGLARKTRLLLDDPALAARLGEAGRQRVHEHFTAAQMVRDIEPLYADPQLAENPGVPS